MDDRPRPLVSLVQLAVLAALLIAAASEFRSPEDGSGGKFTSAVAEDALLSDAARWPEIAAPGL